MITSTHPPAADPESKLRPARYGIAIAVSALVVVALITSSILNYVFLDSIPGRTSLYGLLAVALIRLGTFILVRAYVRHRATRRVHLIRAAVLIGIGVLLWLLVIDVFLYTQSAGPGVAAVCTLACVPTTAFGLWVVRRIDRNEKEPWRLVLVAAAWGAVVATSLVIWAETFWDEVAVNTLVPGPGLDASNAFSAGLFEELVNGVAVLLLFLVMRHEFDDVVDGIVYGAAVGLGFNFMETVVYMSVGGFGQWIFRQWLGLFLGHATYTALIGAGIGIARQVPGLGRKALTILSGFIIAVAAHFAWDAWIWYFPRPSDPGLLLLSIPAQYLAVDGPFFIAVAAMFILGLRIEGRALARELASEAATGSGAVLPQEVAVLLSPARRFEARMRMTSSRGLQGYLWLRRLQRAQLDLVLERWHRARLEIDEPLEAELRLRDKVLAIRYGVRT